MNTSLIIFDFDGVIVKTFDIALETVREHQPDQEISADEYRECFDGNVYEVAKTKKFCFVFEGFFDHYLPKLLKLKPVEGVVDVIRSLAESHSLILISSTHSDVVRKWLEANDLISFFSDIFGSDIATGKVEKFGMAFEKYGVNAEDAVFITDTLGDLGEAERVGIPSIAVSYGHHDRERLSRGKALAIVDHPEEILKVIHQNDSSSLYV